MKIAMPQPQAGYQPRLHRPRVFISGPLTADTAEAVALNVDEAICAAVDVIDAGYAPVVPHLSVYVDDAHTVITGEQLSWEWWLDWCAAELMTCSAVYQIGESTGTKVEAELAARCDIPVVTTIAALREVLAR